MSRAVWALSIFIMIMLAISPNASAQAGLVSLQTRLTSAAVRAGTPAVLEVDVTNTAKKRVVMQLCNQLRAEFNFKIEVWGSDGTLAPATRYMKSIKGEDTGSPKLLIMTNYGFRSIEPGEVLKFFVDLNEIVDLSRAGDYQITVQGFDPETNDIVRAKPIVLRVSDK
jgi:hypothetical protein